MDNVLIYGNGKSRLNFKPRKFKNIVTWGCNRIYRENIHVDNLVALCRDCHGKKTTMENL